MMRIFLCFVLLSGSVFAVNNYTVNPGSSIQTAIQNATIGSAGDCVTAWLTLHGVGACIVVNSGTYTASMDTTKAGTSSARLAVISATQYGAKLVNLNWFVEGGFIDIAGFDITSPSGFAVQSFADSVHVLYNNMHDFTTSSCGAYGVVGFGSGNRLPIVHDNWAIGNIIRHAGNYTADVNKCVHLHGIYDFSVRGILQNNIISGVTGWGIKKDMPVGGDGPSVISNNTIFNNGGGMLFTEQVDTGFGAPFDYSTVSDNIIVSNGVDSGGAQRFGINYYNVGGAGGTSGTHNLVANNLVQNNKPHDMAHHDVWCGTDASGSTPVTGKQINSSGTDSGCPATTFKADSSGTAATFSNFQFDGNTAPIPSTSYNPTNYKLRAGSQAIDSGTSSCAASPGISPCVPSADFAQAARTGALDLGSWNYASVQTPPGAPTSLTVTPH